MANKPDVRVIDISDIRENPVALRTVNRESESYIGLCDSVKEIGILNALNVRLQKEDIDGKIIEYFELVDGLHRYSAACDAGLTQIPVVVVDFNKQQTLEAQLMANIHTVETRPVEYTRQLQRIFAGNPTLTLVEMSAKIAKSSSWISQRLNLLKLEKAVAALVDDGKIPVANAVQLAKLPPEEQLNYVDQAMAMGVEEFVPLAQARAKELRDAARQGRVAEKAEFVPLPRAQKMSALKTEYENPTVGPELCKKYLPKAPGASEGFALGVAWTLNLDPTNVEIRKAQDVEKKARLEDEKKKRTADRAQKKAKDAARLAAEAAEAAKTTSA